jgi:hypothetical protein
VSPKGRAAGERGEICVGVKQFGVGSDRHGGDETVDELANGPTSSPTHSMESRCLVAVRGCGREHRCSTEQTSQLSEMVFVSCSGEDLHRDRVADGEVGIEQAIARDTHR